jgi:hypothetical protein
VLGVLGHLVLGGMISHGSWGSCFLCCTGIQQGQVTPPPHLSLSLSLSLSHTHTHTHTHTHGFNYVALAGQELRLASKSQRSTWLCLQNAETKGHTPLHPHHF